MMQDYFKQIDYFKQYPCPTDRMLTPIIEDFNEIRSEIFLYVKLNSSKLIERLDISNIDIYHNKPFVTLYPTIPDETYRHLKSYQALFKAYAMLRIDLVIAMSKVPKGHKDKESIQRKQHITVLFNLLIILIHGVNLNRISAQMIIQLMSVTWFRATELEPKLRSFGLDDLMGEDPETGQRSILVVTNRKMLDSVWQYVRKNIKSDQFIKFDESADNSKPIDLLEWQRVLLNTWFKRNK